MDVNGLYMFLARAAEVLFFLVVVIIIVITCANCIVIDVGAASEDHEGPFDEEYQRRIADIASAMERRETGVARNVSNSDQVVLEIRAIPQQLMRPTSVPQLSNYIREGDGHGHEDNDQKFISGECPICLEEFKDDGEPNSNESRKIITLSQCDHVFHSECIVQWLKIDGGRYTCPVCRTCLC